MKTIGLIFLLSSQLFAQAPKEPELTPEQLVSDVLKNQTETAKEWRHQTGWSTEKVINQAFNSGRVDLLAACFSVLGGELSFLKKFSEMPLSPFKKRLFIAFLQVPRSDDLDENGLPPVGSGRGTAFYEMCVDEIGPYLPDEDLSIDYISLERFNDRNYRIYLAKSFRSELIAQGELPADEPEVNPPPAPKKRPDLVYPPIDPNTTQSVPQPAEKGQPVRPHFIPWITGGIVALIAFVALIGRALRRKSTNA